MLSVSLPACCTCLSKLISARLIADVQRQSSQLKNRFENLSNMSSCFNAMRENVSWRR